MKKMELNIQLFASGQVDFPADGALQGRLVWTATVATDGGNYSNVNMKLYARRTTSGNTYGSSWATEIQIDSDHIKTSDPLGYRSVSTSWVLMDEYTTTYPHNSDGTQEVYISGYVTGPSGTSLEGRTSSGEAHAVFDRIPRATVCPYIMVGTGESTVYISPASTSFSHTFAYTDSSGNLQTIGSSPAGANLVIINVPRSAYSGFATDSTYHDYVLTLYTYSNGTLVGTSTNTMRVTANENDFRPVVTGMSFYDTNDVTYALTQNRNLIVCNYSHMRATPTVTYNPPEAPANHRETVFTAKYNAYVRDEQGEITGSTEVNEGAILWSDGTIVPLYNPSTDESTRSYYALVTDTRGYSSDSSSSAPSFTPTYIKYFEPYIEVNGHRGGISFERPELFSNQMYLWLYGYYWYGDFKNGVSPTNYNTLTIKYRVFQSGSSTPSDWVTLRQGTDYFVEGTGDTRVFRTGTSSVSGELNLQNPLTSDGTWDYLSSYIVEIVLVDKLNEVPITKEVTSSVPIFDFWEDTDGHKYFQVNGEILKGQMPVLTSMSGSRMVASLDKEMSFTSTTDWHNIEIPFNYVWYQDATGLLIKNGNGIEIISPDVHTVEISAQAIGWLQTSAYEAMSVELQVYRNGVETGIGGYNAFTKTGSQQLTIPPYPLNVTEGDIITVKLVISTNGSTITLYGNSKRSETSLSVKILN